MTDIKMLTFMVRIVAERKEKNLSELTVEESLDLIKQLIENFKCCECKGSGKTSCGDYHNMVYGSHPKHNHCSSCHGTGKDTEKLVEVVKMAYPEIANIVEGWERYNRTYDNKGHMQFSTFLDYLKEQK